MANAGPGFKVTELSSTANKLRDILHQAKDRNEPVTALITGPSGSGKSTVATEASLHAGYRVVRLQASDLSADDAGAIEAAVSEKFQLLSPYCMPDIRKEDDESLDLPVAIILDDLEFWAPAKSTSAADLRLTAALSDELAGLGEEPFTAGAFLATTASVEMVHPTLTSNRFSHIISLHALPVKERFNISLHWLKDAFRLMADSDNEFQSVAQLMAEVTPGFMYVDMQKLFSLLEERFHTWNTLDSQSRTPRQLVNARFFQEVVKGVTPSLFTVVSKTSSLQIKRQEGHEPLYGLDKQTELIRDCLHSVFDNTDVPKDSLLASTAAALKELGRVKGMILHGPSGCGKSALTRLASDMVPINTINFLNADSTSIVSSVIGEAERNLSRLFAVARAIAPSVLIVDNIDILAPCRTDFGSNDNGASATEAFNRLLSTFLTEIDGVKEYDGNAPIFVMATTRSLDLLDPALLRPGRLEMHVPVGSPDPDSRVKILRHFLTRCGKSVPGREIDYDFDDEDFKRRTEGWTAPDVLALGREIVMARLQNCQNKEGSTGLGGLLHALAKMKVSGSEENVSGMH